MIDSLVEHPLGRGDCAFVVGSTLKEVHKEDLSVPDFLYVLDVRHVGEHFWSMDWGTGGAARKREQMGCLPLTE